MKLDNRTDLMLMRREWREKRDAEKIRILICGGTGVYKNWRLVRLKKYLQKNAQKIAVKSTFPQRPFPYSSRIFGPFCLCLS